MHSEMPVEHRKTPGESKSLPLADVLVIDLTRAVAGPFCTMNLGDMGARVIKIEEPGRGDETRHWGPPFIQGESAYYLGINRNKESVALDLKTPEGIRLLRKMCARADVVVENFRPGVTKRLGIDYASLGREDLIYVSISGFGQTGPDRHKAGYDMMIQAMSGLMLVSAYPGGPPVKCGFPVSDIIVSLYAGQAIAASLFARTRDGKGRHIEISLLEGMLAAMCSVTSPWLLAGEEPNPMGATHPNIAPYQIFRCADGMMVIGALNERLWNALCRALNHTDWLKDARYASNRLRVQHREELGQAIESVLIAQPREYWIELLEKAQVPCGPVLSIAETLGLPLITERNTVVSTAHPTLGPLATIRNPMRFAETDLRLDPPPRLGEHTEKIVREFE